jgi:hypothetical protein
MRSGKLVDLGQTLQTSHRTINLNNDARADGYGFALGAPPSGSGFSDRR